MPNFSIAPSTVELNNALPTTLLNPGSIPSPHPRTSTYKLPPSK